MRALATAGKSFPHTSFLQYKVTSRATTFCSTNQLFCVLKLRFSVERDKKKGERSERFSRPARNSTARSRIQGPPHPPTPCAEADQEAHWPFCILALRKRAVRVPLSALRAAWSDRGQVREKGKPGVRLEFLSGSPPPVTTPQPSARPAGPLRLTHTCAHFWNPREKKEKQRFCLPSHPALKISPASAFEESTFWGSGALNQERRPSRVALVPTRRCVITPAV